MSWANVSILSTTVSYEVSVFVAMEKLGSDWAVFTISFVFLVYFLSEEDWIVLKI